MSVDRSLCPICAWRRDCKKKFMHGDSVFCPDYTKDLLIRNREPEVVQEQKKAKPRKKSSDIQLL
ncbi:MAG TPA: hypothetical protein ENN34_13890 [Deltaproteobacteria bacterium]|nr:hypothetical protein [Deltaproteobacteria bacterium]